MDHRTLADRRRCVPRAAREARRLVPLMFAVAALASHGIARAQDAREQVSPFYGSFSSSVPIAVPPFRGLEPKLALSYTSEGHNGFVGVGWNLAGVSAIERVSPGRGTPRGDASDVFILDGQDLVACQTGSVSPSCTAGGTHSTKVESYLRIAFNSAANTWTVTGKDGTRTTFSPTLASAGLTLRWGQTATVDTYGNAVSYAWVCLEGDCYPDRITYNGYAVGLQREARPDPLSFAATNEIGRTRYRLGLIAVQLGPQPIRAYKLSYSTSSVTGRSLLASVQQFGRDVVTQGTSIVSGTALPAQTFNYSSDTSGHTLSVRSANRPPAVSVAGTANCAGMSCAVNFSATATDPEADPIVLGWTGCAVGEGSSLACTASAVGPVTGTATATDDRGGAAAASKAVPVYGVGYTTSEWSACTWDPSYTCTAAGAGGCSRTGTKSRTVSPTALTADPNQAAAVPAASQSCTETAIGYIAGWHVGSWSACSRSCGGDGSQSRAVYPNAWKSTPPDVARPDDSQGCNYFACPLTCYDYGLYRTWGECYRAGWRVCEVRYRDDGKGGHLSCRMGFP